MTQPSFTPELAAAIHNRLAEIWMAHDLDPEVFLSFSLDAAVPLWFGQTAVCTFEDGVMFLDVGEDGCDPDDEIDGPEIP